MVSILSWKWKYNKMKMERAVAYPRSGSSSTVSRSNWNLEMLVYVEGGKPENPAQNPRSKEENLQTQPKYGVNSGIWTRATLIGGALTTSPSLLHCLKQLFDFSVQKAGEAIAI